MVKNPPVNAGDTSLIPGSERSPEEGRRQHLPAVFLPGKARKPRSPAGSRVAKGSDRLSNLANNDNRYANPLNTIDRMNWDRCL